MASRAALAKLTIQCRQAARVAKHSKARRAGSARTQPVLAIFPPAQKAGRGRMQYYVRASPAGTYFNLFQPVQLTTLHRGGGGDGGGGSVIRLINIGFLRGEGFYATL